MNSYQKLWWEQAKSDHSAFLLIRRSGIAQCHSLHYLQMVFDTWVKLTTGHGRDLMRIIAIAIDRFPEYADA